MTRVNEIGGSRAVEVGEEQAPGVEVGAEARRVAEEQPLAKAAVAEVGPTLDRSVADADPVLLAGTEQVDEGGQLGPIAPARQRQI